MKFPPLPFWILSALMWLAIIASWFLGTWFQWIMWPIFVAYVIVLFWRYWGADEYAHRRPSWRVTDNRTTDGDERGTSWAKDERP